MLNMRLPGRKSQVSAPIELFVAVIILAFTLALGLKVIGNVEQGKCIATLQTQTQQLKNAMLDIALGSSGTRRTVYFTFPTCGNQKIVGLQFVLYKQPEYCRLCPGTYGHCWQVVPVAKDPAYPDRYVQVSNAISCINMAGDIQISQCSSGVVQLSKTPCLGIVGADSTCDPLTMGITKSVWDSSLSEESRHSSWNTLSGVGARAFYINLTKTTSLGQGANPTEGVERGSIEICASKAA